MRVTGETAIRLAERFGVPIHKQAGAGEGHREDIPLEDAQWILRNGDPDSIYADAEPEMVSAVVEEIATGESRPLLVEEEGGGGAGR